VDAEAELLMYMRGGSDSRIQPRRDVGAEYFEVGQATVYNGMFASASKYAWYGEDCGGKQEECDTPRDESVASAVESKETDQERMDRETYVSRVVTVIFDNVVQANIECYDTVHAFVEANATELSGAVLDQGAFVARVLSNLSASLRCSFTSKKVLSSLKDLGIQPIHYIFDGLLLPRRALRFPDFTRHKNVIRFLDERCIATTPGDLRSHIATTPGMYNAYVTFCEEEGLQATVSDVVELEQVVKECGIDTTLQSFTVASANPLAEWLEEVVEVTGEYSDVVWAGDLKARWIESHYGPAAAVFSNRLVKAFFAGKQGIEWKDSARIDTICKKGVIRGCKIVGRDVTSCQIQSSTPSWSMVSVL
jgi:hypothetical protein